MPPAVAQSPVATGTSLINAACRRYREAVEQFKRVEAEWQMLPTQEAVTLIFEIQADLRETRQLLDRGASHIPDMSGPELEDVIGKSTRDQIAECRQNACDLGDRVDDLLAASDGFNVFVELHNRFRGDCASRRIEFEIPLHGLMARMTAIIKRHGGRLEWHEPPRRQYSRPLHGQKLFDGYDADSYKISVYVPQPADQVEALQDPQMAFA